MLISLRGCEYMLFCDKLYAFLLKKLKGSDEKSDNMDYLKLELWNLKWMIYYKVRAYLYI